MEPRAIFLETVSLYAILGCLFVFHLFRFTVAAMSVYAFVWSNGSSWFDTVAIAANIRNFPEDRGRVTGLLKSIYGLCASIITVVYESPTQIASLAAELTYVYFLSRRYSSFFKSQSADEAIDVLLFLAAMSAAVGLIGIPTTHLAGPQDTVAISPQHLKFIALAMWLLLVLGLYVLITPLGRFFVN